MSLEFELAGAQIDGARDYQEDAFLITHLSDGDGDPSALVVVADGMGGHAAGNVASNMAVQAFNKHVSSNYPAEAISKILEESVTNANSSIKETVSETPALKGMGCTMVAAILEKGKIWWASVGDSHLYLVRNGELTKLNADHSYGGFLDRMEAAGTPVEQEAGLTRNMLMSAITGDEINEIDCPEEPAELEPGDRVLICSDGMDTLSTGKILEFSTGDITPKECADALMKAVEDAGMPRQDNTTAVVVSVSEVEEIVAEPEVPQQLGPTEEYEYVEEEEYEEEPKSKMGLIIGAVAAVAIIGAGVFFMMGDKQEPTVAIEEPTAVVEEVVETESEAIDEEETVEEAEVVAEESSEAKTEEKKVEPPAAAETVNTDKEFQDTLKSGGKGPVMVTINAGQFKMGSSGSSRHADEQPRHDVSVGKFAISKFEITFAQYDQFANAKGRKVPDSLYLDRETHPVIFTSWDDAFYFTKWLSEETGKKYRLPSEAEWEYAATAGSKAPFPWGYNEEPGKAHCFGCGSGFDPRKPTKIGSFEANKFGIKDMNGNVAEWVHDCWHENYKDAPSDSAVWEGGECSFRVVRGGAYTTPPNSIRSQNRDKFKSENAYDHIGIRIVRDLD